MDTPQRIRLLGVEVDLVTPADVLHRLAAWVAADQPAIVANHNAHSVYLHRKSPAFRAFYQAADLIEIDSRPMIAWGRLLGFPVEPQHRCTYLDWRDAFWALAQAGSWRVFYLGGAPGVADAACRRLAAAWPGVGLAAHHGYFDAAGAANEAVLDEIRAFDPDIVLVGMGMPLQEAWILANRPRLARGVMLSLGAAFDYEAGVQSAAPRWLGRAGLEWLYRLASQPRRLAFRYLVEPWFLLPAAAGDVAARLRRGAAAPGPVGAKSHGR
ncbi:MAG: WecB/TagA/CpsF family glycosyltransferase [Phenylobacterium sp.]